VEGIIDSGAEERVIDSGAEERGSMYLEAIARGYRYKIANRARQGQGQGANVLSFICF
jgi:hypothetical protein